MPVQAITRPVWLILAALSGFSACALAGRGAGPGGGDSGAGAGSDTGPGLSGTGGEAQMQGFDVSPAALQTITVQAGQKTPTVSFTATQWGKPVSAGWSVDKGEIGTVGQAASPTGVFAPSGGVGGLCSVRAALTVSGKKLSVTRQVFVKLVWSQNGPNGSAAENAQIAGDPGSLKQGGGVGGVGGEGLGAAVKDAATLTALASPQDDGKALGLGWLYPYDGTVWPRGLLAPLLMWDSAAGDADAIRLKLTTASGSFSYTGTFARPAILAQMGGKFIRHPIPEDVWEAATSTAGGETPSKIADTLSVELTVAKSGAAHGPIRQTWIVAPARLSGIIYYNSYGTRLALNEKDGVGGDGRYGGAVLSIHIGDTAPVLTAGTNGDGWNGTACRACHSVAANGSRLVAQHGNDFNASSAYDLGPNGSSEKPLALNAEYFPAIYPDGSKALSRSGKILPLPDDGVALPVTGLAAVATDLGTPAFSPDGKLLAFNPWAGPGLTAPKQELLVMSFDAASNTFSGPKVVVDDGSKPAVVRPGWPAFLPDGQSLVFHHQSATAVDGEGDGLWTHKGRKAQIAWTNVSDPQHVTVLNRLNGLDASNASYLPKLAQPNEMSCTGDGYQIGDIDPDHGDDADLNYEPTVNPIASGGYAWVVFTSRRRYGSVATIPPFCSDPRGVDLVENVTTKKLWVAAIDLGAAPGNDASHPAFYLPAQELLAGNSRGFWVLDPCEQDGQPCKSGDACCGGFCEPNGVGGALICDNNSGTGMCSQPQEKCKTTADCCDPTAVCVDGFCAEMGPK